MEKQINLFNVNTTAWTKEDFILLTSLSEEQIKKIIVPIVEKERQLEKEMFKGTINDNTFKEWDLVDKYDNDSLINALKETYPNAIIQMYCADNLDSITI